MPVKFVRFFNRVLDAPKLCQCINLALPEESIYSLISAIAASIAA